jgi:integrase
VSSLEEDVMAENTKRTKGTGSITRRGHRKWLVRFMATDTVGRRRQMAETIVGSKAQAESALRARQSSVAMGTFVQPSQISLGEYLCGWIDGHATKIRATTERGYRGILRLHLLPGLGSFALQAVRPAHIRRLYADMKEAGTGVRTVELTHSVLHKALADARREGLILNSPADLVQVERPKKHRPITWSPAEFSKFNKSAPMDMLGIGWRLSVLLSTRRSELLALKWDAVDLEQGIVKVREAIHRVTGLGLVTEAPKSERSNRKVAFGPRAAELLRKAASIQAEQRLAAGPLWRDDRYVFTQASGAPLDADLFSKSFKKASAALGLKAIPLKNLRATGLTLLADQGVALTTLRDRAGHADVRLTASTYVGDVPNAQREAAGLLEALIS